MGVGSLREGDSREGRGSYFLKDRILVFKLVKMIDNISAVLG
jgi:hypothetical protein